MNGQREEVLGAVVVIVVACVFLVAVGIPLVATFVCATRGGC